MLYEEQQQQMMRIDQRKKRLERNKSAKEEERLEMVDLSGMSLETLPNPSINIGIICKLDLSNNNLQVIFQAN